MKAPITMNQAQVYGISKQNSKEIFQFFQKNFGCTRKVYNLCVDSCYKQLEQAGYTDGDDLPELSFPKVSALKKDYPYLKEADGLGLANSVLDFQKAYKIFRNQKDRSVYRKSALRLDRSGKEPLSFRGLKGIPRFHAKSAGYFSYRTACQYPKEGNALKRPTIRLEGGILYLPKLKHGVKLIIHRKLPEDAHILNATVFMDTDGTYQVSICYSYTFLMEMDYREAAAQEQPIPKGTRFLGLDYSQKDLYVDSEGRKANYPKYYRRSEQKLARLQKSICRKEKNGMNYQKTMRKIQKLHTKIKHQRHDYLQKLSTELVSRYDVIVVEDINLRAMGGCLSLGKNLHDNGFGLFREMLAYKLWKKGSCLVRIDRMYPSSKTCSVCGAVKPDLKLSDRIYICPKCGCVIDRDYNAAVNILEEGKRIFLTYLKEAMEKAEEAKIRQEAAKERRQKKKKAA
ncbi:RNA-guided endonuclease InsQ/TnpB family protein [Dorea amylophila]|uniref:RNA-guided endonuclease InsQ/TnpB family protein n=1 Tax=Dorea amylophila TaxID=2981789 RepID=UPI0022E64F58|nr:transposase [Dorea amylophila]